MQLPAPTTQDKPSETTTWMTCGLNEVGFESNACNCTSYDLDAARHQYPSWLSVLENTTTPLGTIYGTWQTAQGALNDVESLQHLDIAIIATPTAHTSPKLGTTPRSSEPAAKHTYDMPPRRVNSHHTGWTFRQGAGVVRWDILNITQQRVPILRGSCDPRDAPQR
ncbi:hypothetical protein NUW54_g13171 [Trametes sanguinea]|uniref:Uncharacterized protein n=1 Tax=Trametes sanguinea TaxID=158606 RepID=A0ACC1MPX7_9APHY|nr:hypothetical protein NUW54_g13171 [Trametes sanguinea]